MHTKTSLQKFVFPGFNKSQEFPNTTSKEIVDIVDIDFDIINNKHNGISWIPRGQAEIDSFKPEVGKPFLSGVAGEKDAWRVQFNGPINNATSGEYRVKGAGDITFTSIDLWCTDAPTENVDVLISKDGVTVTTVTLLAGTKNKKLTLSAPFVANFSNILKMTVVTNASSGSQLTMRVY